MLIFLEGLPGSGKSYEAVVKHVIPAIESGRKVYARMDGFDRDECLSKIATLTNFDLEDVKQKLIYVLPDDVFKIDKIAGDNSLVVIDEIAKYWAQKGKRSNVSESISDFVKEHRHRGIDILAMDQDLRDVNSLWRRRVDRKLVFMKLDVLGAKNNYKWKMYKAISGESFELVGKGAGKYDSKYFGTYDSHVSIDIGSENYKDDRSVIWRRPAFKFGVPFVIAIFIIVPWYIIRQFNPETSSLIPDVIRQQEVKSKQSNVLVVPAVHTGQTSVPMVSGQQDQKKLLPDDYVSSFVSLGNRIRLVSVIVSKGREPYVVIEFRDDSLRVKERLDNYMLQSLGWYVQVVSLKLVKVKKPGQIDLIATSWPIEFDERLSTAKNDEIRRQGTRDSAQNKQREPVESSPSKPIDIYHVSSGVNKEFDAQHYVTMDKLQWTKGVVR